jgi:hypothetical protein
VVVGVTIPAEAEAVHILAAADVAKNETCFFH